jgi:hypothetical protein
MTELDLRAFRPRWAMKPLVRLEPYPPLLREHSKSIPDNRRKFYDSL